MGLYNRLYEGDAITFDLAAGQPCFKLNKNLTVSSLSEFKTTYEKGDTNNY